MSRLEIYIGGITRTRLERARDQVREQNALSGTRVGEWLRGTHFGPAILGLSPLGLAAASVALIAAFAYVSTPVAVIGNVPVRARHVLFFADGPLQGAADAQRAQLIAAGILVDPAVAINVARPRSFVEVLSGVAAQIAGSTYLPNSVERELPGHPGVDAVYVVSNFAEDGDPARLAQLQSLIRKTGVRLYLNTVDKPPSPGLLAIARESGGGLIKPAKS